MNEVRPALNFSQSARELAIRCLTDWSEFSPNLWVFLDEDSKTRVLSALSAAWDENHSNLKVSVQVCA